MKLYILLIAAVLSLTACKNDSMFPSLTDKEVAEYRRACELIEGKPSNWYWTTNEHIGKVNKVTCDFPAKEEEE